MTLGKSIYLNNKTTEPLCGTYFGVQIGPPMTSSEQLNIGYANETMERARAVNNQTRRMIWIVYLGLVAHVGFVMFWAGLQIGWWQ